MNFYAGRFNLYLAALLMLTLACGCVSSKKKKDEPVGVLRIHIESNVNSGDSSQTVSILRDTPVAVTIASEPILNEGSVLRAALIETPGGFAVEIRFDQTGAWTLEQFSSAYPGKHFAIFGQWGKEYKDGRWLAAPLITQRIADGILTFTPDMSREEAQKLVVGLNHYAVKNKTGQ